MLTKSEEEIMYLLWDLDEPLTSSEIVKKAVNKTWKKSYINLLINSLLKKDMIKVVGVKQMTKNYARTFVPTMTKDAYAIKQISDRPNFADDYTRNYIRHNIIPCLKKLNPSFERTALGLSENAGESADFIKKCAEKSVHDCKGDFGYDCKKLLSLDSAVLKEMLFILLKNNCNISPERKTILLLCEIIRNGGSVELSKQCTAVSKQGILRFVCPKNSPGFNEIPLKNNMTFSYYGKI